ncbi:TolB family protein [Kitasatospora sp. NPDC058965]|uniref:TolB family protein n=1 Tax=Kitasatospora sp. NPDC058965 TaxID=3346682 RepID=UPI003683F5FA
MFRIERSAVLRAVGVVTVAAALAGGTALPAGAQPADGSPAQVCLAPGGAQPDAAASPDAISADGHTVVFDSAATNLVPGGGDGSNGIYACDLHSGRVQRVDVAESGARPNGYGYGGAVSADGRYVAFTSTADNLAPGATRGIENVFLRDLRRGRTELISVGSGTGPQVGMSTWPGISADGRYVAFGSSRADLVPGDTNNVADIFVRDRRAGTTVRVSVHSDGTQGTVGSAFPSVSADGSRVVFVGRDRSLGDAPAAPAAPTTGAAPRLARFYPLFSHDLRTGKTVAASVEPNGVTADVTNGTISADGRYAEFTSLDNNYRAPSQVMVRDLERGSTVLVSAAPDGSEADRDASLAGLSADDRYAFFGSAATNMLPGGTPGAYAYYRRDLRTGRTERLFELPGEVGAATAGQGPAVDGSGCTLVFGGDGSKLVPGDTNQNPELFAARLHRH